MLRTLSFAKACTFVPAVFLVTAGLFLTHVMARLISRKGDEPTISRYGSTITCAINVQRLAVES